MTTQKFILQIVFVFSFLLIISCEKEDLNENSECRNFSEALIYFRSDSVKDVIDELTSDLTPEVTEDDDLGHRNNLELLIGRINSRCETVSATLGCYACIFTNPPQSEIVVATDSAGVEINRTIDILSPEDDVLEYVNVHHYSPLFD